MKIGISSGYVDIDYYSIDGFVINILNNEDGFLIEFNGVIFSDYIEYDVDQVIYNYSNYLL